MRRIVIGALLALSVAQLASAEVSLTERKALRQHLAKANDKPGNPPTRATGSQALIDASGVKYFINTNITFSTSSSASGAASEASYTAAVNATTAMGGTVSTTLNDAFDGYNALCLGINGANTSCRKADANFIIYNQNGAATTECNGRQVVFPAQTATVGSTTVQMSRKVFVPTNDSFARWLDTVTNTGASPATFNVIIATNMGSDANTRVVSSSSGDATATAGDTWVSTFQNYSGTTSSDPRLGHVLQGAGAATPLSIIHFADGDDNPYWGYAVTLAPGETKTIANFVAIQPSKAGANAKAAELAGLPANAEQCLTANERTAITNFAPPVPPVPTLSQTGLAILCLALAAFAVFRLRRRTA